MQGTWVQSLGQEDLTFLGATKPMGTSPSTLQKKPPQ